MDKRKILKDVLGGKTTVQEIKDNKVVSNYYRFMTLDQYSFYSSLMSNKAFLDITVKYEDILNHIEYFKAVLQNTPLHFKQYFEFVNRIPDPVHAGYNKTNIFIELDYNQYIKKYQKGIDIHVIPYKWNYKTDDEHLKQVNELKKTAIKFTKKEMKEILKYKNLSKLDKIEK